MDLVGMWTITMIGIVLQKANEIEVLHAQRKYKKYLNLTSTIKFTIFKHSDSNGISL